MNRNTYWITLQFAWYSVAAIFATLVAQVPRAALSKNSAIWLTIFGLQLIAALGSQMTWEVLNTIIYTETRLRPLVSELVGDRAFWGYDAYTGVQKNARFGSLEMLFQIVMFGGMCLLAPVAIGVAAHYMPPTRYREWAWLIANMIACLAVLFEGSRLGLIGLKAAKVTQEIGSRHEREVLRVIADTLSWQTAAPSPAVPG